MAQLIKMPTQTDLSDRELEILRLVATGASNKEIAQQLFISANTVKVHLRNIFAKIGAASRTEAAMYAASIGLVEGIKPSPEDGNNSDLTQKTDTSIVQEAGLGNLDTAPSHRVVYIGLGIAIMLIFLVGALIMRTSGRSLLGSPALPIPSQQESTRWQVKANLIIPRTGLALVNLNNELYAIGGESPTEITGTIEKYNLASDSWEPLTPKPTAVRDIQAASIGGKIYVPGGKTEPGEVTDRLEIYNPLENAWSQGKPMPSPRSAYGIAAFEGKLYVFGGWDGQKYVDSIFAFDPESENWETLAPMPFAAGFPGVVVSGDQIHVLGGFDGQHPLPTHYRYLPDRGVKAENTWQKLAPLPEPRYAMGVASVADIIYILGGEGNGTATLPNLEYISPDNQWIAFSITDEQGWSHGSLALLGTDLHALGGENNQSITDQHLAYKAIYVVNMPIIKQ